MIGMHIGAMFLPSLVTGGSSTGSAGSPMAVAAGGDAAAAGLVAAVAPGDSLPLLTVALVLLGLGWNFGLISGTALIVDSTPLADPRRAPRAPSTCSSRSPARAAARCPGVVVGGDELRHPRARRRPAGAAAGARGGVAPHDRGPLRPRR